MSIQLGKNSDRLDLLTSIVIRMGGVSVCIVLVIYFFNFHGYEISENPSEWGSFGDFFGGVLNPILSFLSLILVLVTIKQQKISLQQTSDQIQASFEEMTKSVVAQEKQADLAEQQLQSLSEKNKTEDLVRVLREVLNDINVSLSEEIICFSNINKKRTLKSQILDVVNRRDISEIMVEFEKYHEDKIKNLDSSIQYYRNILNSLQDSDCSGIMYQYYDNKIKMLELSSGFKKYKV